MDQELESLPEPPRSRSPGPALPPELVDMVIDCLASDMHALRACALAARAWLPRTRLYLHRTLALASRGQCERAAAVYADPALARYVREVRLANGPGPDERSRAWTGAGAPAPEDADWLDAVPPVVALLRGVPLERASFERMRLEDVDSRGAEETAAFPTVTAIALKDFECSKLADFEAWLKSFPLLEDITADQLAVDAPASPSSAGYRPKLKGLSVRNSEGQQFLINWYLAQPKKYITLQRLTYVVEPFRIFVPQDQLLALGATLQHVTLIFSYCTPAPMLRADPLLEALSNIESLTIEFATEYGALYGCPSLPTLLGLVTSTRLTALTLRFRLDTGPDALTRAKLGDTDRLLSTLPQFRLLDTLLVEVHAAHFDRLRRLPCPDAWVADAEARARQRELALREAGGGRSAAPVSSVRALESANQASGRACHAHAEFVETRKAWKSALATMRSALPEAYAKGLLMFRTVDAPLSPRWRFRGLQETQA